MSGCHGFNSFKSYKTIQQGIIGIQSFNGNLKVYDVETMDTGKGISLITAKGGDKNYVHLENAVIMGESTSIVDSGSFCQNIYGFWTSSSVRSGKTYPVPKMPLLPYDKLMGYGTWEVYATAKNVTFKNWASATRSCNGAREQKALFVIPTGSDLVPMQTFTDTTFDNVQNDALARLMDPNPGWRNEDDCGLLFPCTGPDNFAFKFFNASARGLNVPDINRIDSPDNSFQIIPDNPQATNWIFGCSRVAEWNANLCYNENIGQLLFESLDADTEDRSIVPISLLGQGNNEFNNTLNSFMDHCWDGHYTCQKRLSRFPGLVETRKKYEIYYTGTPPKNTRYTLVGGVQGQDYVHAIIDFSESRLYKVFDVSSGTKVEKDANEFSRVDKKQKELEYTSCGEYRYESVNYVYEFHIPIGCTVRFEAQDSIQGNIRLQMTYDEFFDKGGSTWFALKLANALSIPQSRIRFVGVYEGSVVVNWYIESDPSSNDAVRELTELNDYLASQHASGALDFDDVPVLDVSGQVVTSDGVVTSSTDGYTKKDISKSVYVLMAIASIAVVVGLTIGAFKLFKASKYARSVVNIDRTQYEKGNASVNDASQNKFEGKNNPIEIYEESKMS